MDGQLLWTCLSVHRSLGVKQQTLQMTSVAALEGSLIRAHGSTFCNRLLFPLPTVFLPFTVHQLKPQLTFYASLPIPSTNKVPVALG